MKNLDKVVSKKFPRGDGPCLDNMLSSFHVQRQAYYSGTFVGNHVHSCLRVQLYNVKTYTASDHKMYTQENHINMLCDAVPSVARQHCPSLLSQAQLIADKHRESLLLFSACHNIYEKTMWTQLKWKSCVCDKIPCNCHAFILALTFCS